MEPKFNIRPAEPHAGVTATAFFLIHRYPKEGHRMKQGIDGTQGTYKPAKSPVANGTKDDTRAKHKHLPGKQKPDLRLQGFIQ